MRRIEEDMRNYYLLTYVPKNDRLDGAFRTIAVKVKRPGVAVAGPIVDGSGARGGRVVGVRHVR